MTVKNAFHRTDTKIRFPCPACKFSLSAPAAKSGQQSRCPKCGQPVLVP